MEQNSPENINVPQRTIFKDLQLWVGSFLGGPLVAGYIISKNFEQFGELTKARNTKIIAVAFMIAFILLLLFAPFPDRIPNILFPLVYSAIAVSLMRMYLGKRINEHISIGGEIYSWWKTIGLSLAIGLVTTILMFGSSFLVESIQNRNTITKEYGTSKHNISFNTNNLTENEVDLIAEVLRKTNFFDNGYPWYLAIRKDDTRYEIFVLVEKTILNHPEHIEFLNNQLKQIQILLPNNKVRLNLSVDTFDNIIKKIE